MQYKQYTETNLQKECNDILRKLHIPFIHIPSRAARKCQTITGWPDLFFWDKGKWYAYELKVKHGRTHSAQDQMLRSLRANGAVVRIITSIKGFLSELEREGVLASGTTGRDYLRGGILEHI